MKKTITLIEDDIDGTIILLTAPTEELLREDADSLWETFSQYRNKDFNDPTMPGPFEPDGEGGLGCRFDVCYPTKIAAEVVEDWLAENSTIHEMDKTGETYLYS